MREIKFRVWDGMSMRHSFDGFSSEVCVLTDVWNYFNDSNYNVMQFTGLKDKNGIEIYEGDVVSCNHFDPENYVVEFIEGGFCLTNKSVGIPMDVTHMEDSKGKHFKIVGNIHENPELL